MKILGWMHRKLRENSIEPLKIMTIAHPQQLDEQQHCPEPTYHSPYSRQTRTCQKSSTGLKANRMEEVFEEEASTMVHELFHGFLAIGTLGAESFIMEPMTTQLTMSFENVAEKETEVTESDLKLINSQLAKFLEAEVKDTGNESSERSSHTNIITHSSKKIEGEDAKEHGNMAACPLQEYLFGSSLELPDIPADIIKREKATLGELFEKHSIAPKHKIENIDKGLEANGIHFMKKILKKLHFLSRKKGTTSTGGNATNSGSTKRKVPKLLRSFHRKIHPETAETKAKKSQKYGTKTSNNGGYQNEDAAFEYNNNSMFLNTTMLNKGNASFRMSPSLSSDQSSGNGEYWITTDADFLVLEL